MCALTSDRFDALKAQITNEHQSDQAQIEAVFSTERRLLVQAPAGYGKTKTMVSRIAFLIGSGRLADPKKILCLTFSVSAAYKIRRDMSSLLPKYFPNAHFNQAAINNRVYVSNYHGFTRKLLSIYGGLLSPSLKNIEKLKIVDDDSEIDLSNQCSLTEAEVHILKDFVAAVRSADLKAIADIERHYNQILLNKILPSGHITYNGILLCGYKVLTDYPEIRNHYQSVFTHLVVDEFQDTNYLAWRLIKLFHHDHIDELFLGDSLQRIYGFIGAVPNILHSAATELRLKTIPLLTNHRFGPGTLMHDLDAALRKVADNPLGMQTGIVNLPLKFCGNQTQESKWIAKTIQKLLKSSPNSRIAILVRGRSKNADCIFSTLREQGTDTFWALFTEDESSYVNFHRSALKALNVLVKQKGTFGTGSIDPMLTYIANDLNAPDDNTISALSQLFRAFLKRVQSQYLRMPFSEKLFLIEDCLANRSLRQNMEYLDNRVTLATAHGAKGLEWDHVILPDMERDQFPSWFALCRNCNSRDECQLRISKSNQDAFLNELSLFYVAITRARRSLVFSSSKYQITKKGSHETNVSCFLRLPGLAIVKVDGEECRETENTVHKVQGPPWTKRPGNFQK